MFRWFERRRHLARSAHNFYGSIVAASRRPELFSRYGVPDTVEGRLEMLIAHMALVLERLRSEGAAGNALAQRLVDIFYSDLDTSVRELGIGDMAVPKKMRELATMVQHRWERYREALQSGEQAKLAKLAAGALARPGPADDAASGALACYMSGLLERLKDQPVESLDNIFETASIEAMHTASGMK